MTRSPDDTTIQFLNQHLRLLQVCRIKAFGTPIVEFS